MKIGDISNQDISPETGATTHPLGEPARLHYVPGTAA
jgi:hypothetical protein